MLPIIRQNRGLYSSSDHWLDTLFSDLSTNSSKSVVSQPTADIYDTDDHIYVDVDLPGVSKSDIKLQVDQSILTVSGTRNSTSNQQSATAHRSERSFGHFSRHFELGDHLDIDRISASLTDGVLQIAIPKLETAKPKRLDIAIS